MSGERTKIYQKVIKALYTLGGMDDYENSHYDDNKRIRLKISFDKIKKFFGWGKFKR